MRHPPRIWTRGQALTTMQDYLKRYGIPVSEKALRRQGWPCPKREVQIQLFGGPRSFRRYIQAAQQANTEPLRSSWVDELLDAALARRDEPPDRLPQDPEAFDAALQRAAVHLTTAHKETQCR